MAEQKRNALVSGGAGFLGSHLCEYLLEHGRRVICVDDYVSGSEKNIDHLLSHPDFEFVRHDISTPLDLKTVEGAEWIRGAHEGIEEVYHLACPHSPRYYLSHPVEVMQCGVAGTTHMLTIARQNNARFLFVSDAVAYGELPSADFIPNEEYLGTLNHLDPSQYYGLVKRAGEALVDAYVREFSLHASTVRLFNVYGPRMALDDGRMVPEYIARAFKGEDLIVSDSARVTSLCYVADAVNGLEKIMTADKAGIYNLGQNTTYTVGEIVNHIIAATESSSQMVEGQPSGADMALYAAWGSHMTVPDITKVKNDTLWFPVVLLEEGLDQTVDYMKSLRGAKGIV